MSKTIGRNGNFEKSDDDEEEVVLAAIFYKCGDARASRDSASPAQETIVDPVVPSVTKIKFSDKAFKPGRKQYIFGFSWKSALVD